MFARKTKSPHLSTVKPASATTFNEGENDHVSLERHGMFIHLLLSIHAGAEACFH